MHVQQRIVPFLSYVDQAEAAASFYTALIPDSHVDKTTMNPSNGSVLTVEFTLGGIQFVALNAGVEWKFTEAFSLSVACETQAEIDRLWSALTEGGREVQCGWLTDRYGMSWQIVPAQMMQFVSDPDPQRVQRVMQAMFQMVKLDLAALQAAYDG